MSKNRVEQKAELMREAEDIIIDELLNWQTETERPNFDQIEVDLAPNL